MYNYLILTDMMTVERISVIKSAGIYEYNGAVINVTEITGSGKLRGTCKLSDGTEFSFTNSASGLAKRIDNGGKTTKSAVIPCGHSDNSTCHGEHKTVAVSAARIERKHRSVMSALNVLNDFLGYQDGLSMQVHTAWHEFKTEQDRLAAEAEQLRLKREAERKEAEAKKQAEAEAKKLEEERKLRSAMIEAYAKKQGLTLEVAEANLTALGII